MHTITLATDGRKPLYQAQEAAIANNYNCYSKPANKDYFDYQDKEAKEYGFYFSRSGSLLEVIIKTDPGFVAEEQPAPVPVQFTVKESKPIFEPLKAISLTLF